MVPVVWRRLALARDGPFGIVAAVIGDAEFADFQNPIFVRLVLAATAKHVDSWR